MSDEISIDTVQKSEWNPKFRKRKKHDGMAIGGELADQLDALRPQVDAGMFCKGQCRKWIPWKKLDITYEVRGGLVFRIWWCECGNQLKEDVI